MTQGEPDLPESVLDLSSTSQLLSESPRTIDRDFSKNRELSSRASAANSELLSESPVKLEGKLGLISSETKLNIGELPSSATTEPDGEENSVLLPIRENTPIVSESPVIYPDNSDLKEPLCMETMLSVEDKRESISELPTDFKENSEKPRTSSEPLSVLPNQPHLVSLIQNSEGTEKIISESKVAKTELQRESGLVSKPLDDLPSSSLPTQGNKNSQVVPLQLTGAALARRLNVSPSTLRHKKNARNFGQWTSGHDPNGIAWYFDGQQFVSVLPHNQNKTL